MAQMHPVCITQQRDRHISNRVSPALGSGHPSLTKITLPASSSHRVSVPIRLADGSHAHTDRHLTNATDALTACTNAAALDTHHSVVIVYAVHVPAVPVQESKPFENPVPDSSSAAPQYDDKDAENALFSVTTNSTNQTYGSE